MIKPHPPHHANTIGPGQNADFCTTDIPALVRALKGIFGMATYISILTRCMDHFGYIARYTNFIGVFMSGILHPVRSFQFEILKFDE